MLTATPDTNKPLCQRCGAAVADPCDTEEKAMVCELPTFAWPNPNIPTDWQPIETAPRDGTPALFCHWTDTEQDVLPIASGFWSRLSEGWFAELSGHMMKPTHWMPLPAPPRT